MHPTEPAYPCCLPALGEFGTMSPHEGLRRVYGLAGRTTSRGPREASDVISGQPVEAIPSAAEDSHSGLVRTLGKRVE